MNALKYARLYAGITFIVMILILVSGQNIETMDDHISMAYNENMQKHCINCPDGWEHSITEDEVVFLNSDTGAMISIKELQSGRQDMGTIEYALEIANEQFDVMEVVESDHIEEATGMNNTSLVFLVNENSKLYKCKQVVVFDSKSAYSFTLKSSDTMYNNSIDEFDLVVESFLSE